MTLREKFILEFSNLITLLLLYFKRHSLLLALKPRSIVFLPRVILPGVLVKVILPSGGIMVVVHVLIYYISIQIIRIPGIIAVILMVELITRQVFEFVHHDLSLDLAQLASSVLAFLAN